MYTGWQGQFRRGTPAKAVPIVEKLNWNGGLVVKMIKNAKMH